MQDKYKLGDDGLVTLPEELGFVGNVFSVIIKAGALWQHEAMINAGYIKPTLADYIQRGIIEKKELENKQERQRFLGRLLVKGKTAAVQVLEI